MRRCLDRAYLRFSLEYRDRRCLGSKRVLSAVIRAYPLPTLTLPIENQREYDAACIIWLTKAIQQSTHSFQNNTHILALDPDIARPQHAIADFQRCRHLFDEMLALPNNAWDAYYLALTWRVRGKIPNTIIDTLNPLGVDMRDAREMNNRASGGRA